MYAVPGDAMKTRVQIYLDDDQDRKLERLAKVQGVSKSQLIRESIRFYLDERISVEEDPALEILGSAGSVGRSDLAERHDEHIARLTSADHGHET